MRLITVLDMTIWTLSASLDYPNINSGVIPLDNQTDKGSNLAKSFLSWLDNSTDFSVSNFAFNGDFKILKSDTSFGCHHVATDEMQLSEMWSGNGERWWGGKCPIIWSQPSYNCTLFSVEGVLCNGTYLYCTIQYLAIVKLTVFRLVWAKCPIVWAQYSSNCTFLVS